MSSGTWRSRPVPPIGSGLGLRAPGLKSTRLTDEASANGTITLGAWYDEYPCTGGSGSFVLVVYPKLSPAEYDLDGSNEIGEWEHEGGTGPYDKLYGEGTITYDFGQGVIVCTGRLTR